MNKLFANILNKRPLFKTLFISKSPIFYKFSTSSNINANNPSVYNLAVPFYNVLAQYQIQKNSDSKSSLNDLKAQLTKHAEEVLGSKQTDPKLVMNMMNTLNQENLLNEQIMKNVLSTIEILPHNVLHKFNFAFLVILIRNVQLFKIEMTEQQIKQLQSLILYFFSLNNWAQIKEFLDLVANRTFCEKIFSEEVEKRLAKLLNYAQHQISTTSFFISLAFSIHNIASLTEDRYKIIPELEAILEEKINRENTKLTLSDVQQALSFFSDNFAMKNETFVKIAPYIFTAHSLVPQDVILKFMLLSIKNNYNIIQNSPEYLKKLPLYIERCENIKQLRLFAPYLTYFSLLNSPEHASLITLKLKEFLPTLLHEKEVSEYDLELIRFYLQNSSIQDKHTEIVQILDNFLKSKKDKLSLGASSLLYVISSYLPAENQSYIKSIEEYLIDRFTREKLTAINAELIEALKLFLRAEFLTTHLTEERKLLLSNIEILIHDVQVQNKLNFRDLHQMLEFLYFAFKNKLVTATFCKELWKKLSAKYVPRLTFEEMIFLLPLSGKLSWMHTDILELFLSDLERLVTEGQPDLKAILRLLVGFSNFDQEIIANRSVRKLVKGIWFGTEDQFFEKIITRTQKKKKKNPFLPDMDEGTEETVSVSQFLTPDQLTVIFQIYSYLVKWNIGSRIMFEGYHLIGSKYFDSLDNKTLAKLAYDIAEINSSKEKLQEKFEQYILNKNACGDPEDAIRFAWYFGLKANYNQELWNIIMRDLGKTKSLKEIPKYLLLDLYELLFMLRLEASHVQFGAITNFFDELDELWEKEGNIQYETSFKKTIFEILDEECYKITPNFKASLYVCDYGYGDKEAVIIQGDEKFVGNTQRDIGHMVLRKRLLKRMGYKLHVIDKVNFERNKKYKEKVEYIKKMMKGIPIDKERWVKKQRAKGIFYAE